MKTEVTDMPEQYTVPKERMIRRKKKQRRTLKKYKTSKASKDKRQINQNCGKTLQKLKRIPWEVLTKVILTIIQVIWSYYHHH